MQKNSNINIEMINEEESSSTVADEDVSSRLSNVETSKFKKINSKQEELNALVHN